MQIHTIKLANISKFWIQTEASEDEINNFRKYFDANRLDNGTIAPSTIEGKNEQRSEFVKQMNNLYKTKIYARSDIEYSLKAIERNASWLYRRFKEKKNIQYTSVTEWVNGGSKPLPENMKIINQILRARL